MNPALADLEFRAGRTVDADAMNALSTGPIAGKRAFIVESLARRNTVVAAREERVVGYIIWDRAFFGRPFVWLIGVDPGLRRRGIATRLLHEFASRCAGEALFTSTNESNRGMQTLLLQSGFAYSGKVENLDPGDPELFYFKSAGDA